mgnify:CR=1 FL=1
MGKDMVSLTIEGEVRQYPAGTSFLAISQEYQEKYPDDIVLVVYNNRLRELNKTAQRDGMLSFVTTADKTGKKTYRRSVTLLMQKAVYNLWGSEHISVRVLYSIGQGYYCELRKKADGQERVIAVDEARAEKYNIPQGLLVYTVTKDGPGHKAGLYADDIITEYDGTAATDNDSFVDYLRRKAVGDTVKIRYWRDGEYYECIITVGDLNSIGSEILDDAYGGSKFGF